MKSWSIIDRVFDINWCSKFGKYTDTVYLNIASLGKTSPNCFQLVILLCSHKSTHNFEWLYSFISISYLARPWYLISHWLKVMTKTVYPYSSAATYPEQQNRLLFCVTLGDRPSIYGCQPHQLLILKATDDIIR